MRNGNAVTLSTLLLAILAVVVGCDTSTPPRQAEGQYELDAKRNRAWILTNEGVRVRDALRPQGVALSLPEWVWAGPPYGCAPVLALGPKGEAIITSDVVPALWRVDPDTLAVTVHYPVLDADANKDSGFSALAYWSKHGAYYASRNGALWRIDPEFRTAQKIAPVINAHQPCLGANS
jgi:hypothetical protein